MLQLLQFLNVMTSLNQLQEFVVMQLIIHLLL